MKHALKSVPGLADVGVPMEMGMAPELHPDTVEVSFDETVMSN